MEQTTLPPIVRIFLGLTIFCLGMLMVIPAAILRVIPVVAPLGLLASKGVYKVCHYGGGEIGAGFRELFSSSKHPKVPGN